MLIVSRPDINVDAITEIDPQQRFIKLPITNYLKLLDVYDTINRPQIALINAVNDPKYRFICAALARRLGKTYIANIIGQLVTLVPNSNVLIISPNYNLSSSLKLSYITSMNPHLLINTSSDLIERANMTISPSDIKTSSNSYFIKQISNHEDIKKYNEIDNDLDFFNSKFKVIFD